MVGLLGGDEVLTGLVMFSWDWINYRESGVIKQGHSFCLAPSLSAHLLALLFSHHGKAHHNALARCSYPILAFWPPKSWDMSTSFLHELLLSLRYFVIANGNRPSQGSSITTMAHSHYSKYQRLLNVHNHHFSQIMTTVLAMDICPSRKNPRGLWFHFQSSSSPLPASSLLLFCSLPLSFITLASFISHAVNSSQSTFKF